MWKKTTEWMCLRERSALVHFCFFFIKGKDLVIHSPSSQSGIRPLLNRKRHSDVVCAFKVQARESFTQLVQY